MNFEVGAEVKDLQNPVRGVRNQTLRVCDIQREQTRFVRRFRVQKRPKEGPKNRSKIHHSRPTFASEDGGRRRRTRPTCTNNDFAQKDAPDASVPLPIGSMGRDKGRGKPLPWEVGWRHG